MERAVGSVGRSHFTFEQADPEEGVTLLLLLADQLPHGLVLSRAPRAGQVFGVQPAVGLGATPSLHLSQHGEHPVGAICKRREHKVRLLCGGRGKVRKARRSESGRDRTDLLRNQRIRHLENLRQAPKIDSLSKNGTWICNFSDGSNRMYCVIRVRVGV